MTRSSIKELFTPYKELELVLHSTRKIEINGAIIKVEWDPTNIEFEIWKMGIATLETYLDSFEKAIQFTMKTMNGKHGWFDEHELMGDDDDDISDLEDYLILKNPPYYVNEEEEKFKERRCKLLGIPYVKPPACKSKKFETCRYDVFVKRKQRIRPLTCT
uniref:Uncharacterized protein n=1 Tax=Tanacetum cinerariifolium TaxID=118510 RepID=A0A6L2K7X1_TANCI|nr:hypothetical protein [Tanacetum cinerariifolium]